MRARGSALTISVLMVFLDQKFSMLVDNSLNFVQAVNRNSAINCQNYRIEPKFAIQPLEAYMDVGGLVPFIRKKVEAVRTNS